MRKSFLALSDPDLFDQVKPLKPELKKRQASTTERFSHNHKIILSCELEVVLLGNLSRASSGVSLKSPAIIK